MTEDGFAPIASQLKQLKRLSICINGYDIQYSHPLM
jgi:hypothetical protein